MPTFTSTLSRMKSVKLSFKKRAEEPTEASHYEENMSYPMATTTTTSVPISDKSFSEALTIISQEAQNTKFDDVFDSFFFNDKRCQHRALFIAARLKQTLDIERRPSDTSFWRLVTHRLYTLNYILFVLPPDSTIQFTKQRPGEMEANFAVRYALEHRKLKRRKTLLEDAFELEKKKNGDLPEPGVEHDKTVKQAKVIIEQCLESESKLGHAERDAMYVFHSLRAGLLDTFVPHIELEEDRTLRHKLKRAVEENKESKAYQNPFEDEECIVTEDSEYYDGWVPTRL